MMHDHASDRKNAMHLAVCAAQVMEAVAAGMAHTGRENFDMAHALEAIRDLHECHTYAAIIVMAQMLNDVDANLSKWVNDIPRFTAMIASLGLQ